MRFSLRGLMMRRPPECAAVGEVLQHYLDAELDSDELAERVTEHLDICRECGMTAEDYQRIKTALARRGPTDTEVLARLRGFVDELCRRDPV